MFIVIIILFCIIISVILFLIKRGCKKNEKEEKSRVERRESKQSEYSEERKSNGENSERKSLESGRDSSINKTESLSYSEYSRYDSNPPPSVSMPPQHIQPKQNIQETHNIQIMKPPQTQPLTKKEVVREEEIVLDIPNADMNIITGFINLGEDNELNKIAGIRGPVSIQAEHRSKEREIVILNKEFKRHILALMKGGEVEKGAFQHILKTHLITNFSQIKEYNIYSNI